MTVRWSSGHVEYTDLLDSMLCSEHKPSLLPEGQNVFLNHHICGQYTLSVSPDVWKGNLSVNIYRFADIEGRT